MMSYQNMKLLLLIPSLGSGGAERQLVTLAILFKKKGFDVEFLIYQKDLFYLHILEKNFIKVNILDPKSYFDRIIKVRCFIKNYSPDCVISFLETCDFLNCFSSIGLSKYKVITTELSSKNSTFTTLRGKFFGWFRRYSNYIVCNSYNAKNKWINNYPKYQEMYKVIYNPVILQDINTEYIYKKNGKFNLVVAASYQYLKNPIGLINAVAVMDVNLRNSLRIDWYGRVEVRAGDTKAYDEAFYLIEKYNLQSTIFLHQETKDIANKMNEADAVGLFSQLEGLPNAICESMLIGKPIIMTKVSDFSILVDENNGFLCDCKDINSIKDALEAIVCLNENDLKKLGKNSKIKAEKLFSLDVILEKWLRLIY